MSSTESVGMEVGKDPNMDLQPFQSKTSPRGDSGTEPKKADASLKDVPKFSDPPALDHPMPAWVHNLAKEKANKKKVVELRLPTRPAYAAPNRMSDQVISAVASKESAIRTGRDGYPEHDDRMRVRRPAPHKYHMFTPRAIPPPPPSIELPPPKSPPSNDEKPLDPVPCMDG